MIEKGVKKGTRIDWDWGMDGAAEGGHVDIVKLIKSKMNFNIICYY